MIKILDVSGSYLRIFTEKFSIDYNLPKWKKIIQNTGKVDNPLGIGSNKSDCKVNVAQLLQWTTDDFNIMIGKNISKGVGQDIKVSSQNAFILESEFVSPNIESNIKKTFWQKIKEIFTKTKKQKFEFSALEFFSKVKLVTKESEKLYIDRIEPYIAALKQAQESGQEALADILKADIFMNKYESLLRASGFNKKITEEQVVEFVKKTEKGVQLVYIKNYVRPIPKDVFEIKKKADSLEIFDNYCVMFYDKSEKSYKQTKKEQEAERKKKADPILFGMIKGSRSLYYIADWTDEFCNLTIDEFLKISGIDKDKIEIPKEINL